MLHRLALAGLFLLAAPAALAQSAGTPSDDWYLDDVEADGVYGLSVHRAYEALAGREPERTVVVAVIDSGVDIEHEDLEGQIWTNEDEVAGNGVDDDGNGYVDDVHGWNFIGGADGRNVDHDTFELTREVARLRREAAAPDASDETRAELERMEANLADERAEYEALSATLEGISPLVQQADAAVKAHLGRDAYTLEDIEAIETSDPALLQARDLLTYLAANGLTAQDVADQFAYVRARLQYGLDPSYDPRDIVGDDYANPEDRFYGNPDVHGPDPSHGTAVAGVIAGRRGNGVGVDGVAARVLIMPVRAVPDGDERDKDVANAIRYAVDNGAHVVNMSFGKSFSPQKPWVDEAVRYAEARGVLLVHASGNDGADLETKPNFPNRQAAGDAAQPEAANWIEVGASRWDTALAADFSNYGRTRVDVFAPGARIYSLAPDDGTTTSDGTSLAAPLVSGVAALLLAYFPDLTPTDARAVLLDSAVRHDADVPQPGEEGGSVRFGDLSVTGGVVNAYEAVRLAERRAAHGSH